MPVLSGEPVPLWRGVWGGWDIHGWGDAPSSCLSIPPAAQPTQCPVVSSPTILSPTPSPCADPSCATPPWLPVIARGSPTALLPGLCHPAWGSSRLHVVLVMLVLLTPPLSSPILPSLHADPTSPFPSLPMASCPCAPHHLQLPASSRLTTLNCPSLRSPIAHHDSPLLLLLRHPSSPIHFVPVL